jgi:hypothetical protein
MDHRVNMIAAEPDHQGHRARAHHFQSEELVVEAPRRFQILGTQRAVREEFGL